MNATMLGLIAGLVLGLAAAFGGFVAFVVLLLGGVGLLVGRYLDGRLDLSGLGMAGRDRTGR